MITSDLRSTTLKLVQISQKASDPQQQPMLRTSQRDLTSPSPQQVLQMVPCNWRRTMDPQALITEKEVISHYMFHDILKGRNTHMLSTDSIRYSKCLPLSWVQRIQSETIRSDIQDSRMQPCYQKTLSCVEIIACTRSKLLLLIQNIKIVESNLHLQYFGSFKSKTERVSKPSSSIDAWVWALLLDFALELLRFLFRLISSLLQAKIRIVLLIFFQKWLEASLQNLLVIFLPPWHSRYQEINGRCLSLRYL